MPKSAICVFRLKSAVPDTPTLRTLPFADGHNFPHCVRVQSSQPISLLDRIHTLAVVLASYAASFLPLLVFGGEGVFWIKVLLTASLPIFGIAALVTVIFAHVIVANPKRWAAIAGFVAIVLSVFSMWLFTHTLIGLVSIVIALPAVGIFAVVAKWLPQTSTAP